MALSSRSQRAYPPSCQIFTRAWSPRQSLLSARYTTRLEEMVRARSW
ncbi:DUF4113 domain-containing protein [Gluconobacter sp. DsW_056]|nr:DUF4113 domain-containing protein [Gluconobacter sp. DsW_056]